MAERPRGSGDRLVHLLKLIAEGPQNFSLGELTARADLPASTVHRLLKVLERTGLAERGPRQTYRAGRELHRLASLIVSRFDLVRSARPFLDALVAEWHETAVLCVYSPTKRRAVIAETVLTPHPLRFDIEKGGQISLPWGSLGRAILAFVPPGEVEAIIREERVGPLTGRPRLPREELQAELDKVRTEGIARYYEPSFDLAGIAGPVFGPEREVLGSIGVIMPSPRFQLHMEDDLAIAVRDAARELSHQARISYS